MESIGRIGGLWRYPVKSLAGEALETAVLDATGIVGDRRWALKNRRSNELVNCKVFTSLLTIGARYRQEPAPGYGVVHAEITLPDGRVLMTGDASANAAISAIAGQPLELWPLLPPSEEAHYRLRQPFTPEITKQRMGLRPDDPYPDFSAYEQEMIAELQYYFSPRGSYKDAYALHYVTSASLATLAGCRPGLDVTARRFRPNFYIEGVVADGFPELDWTGFDMLIGDVVLNCGQETVRCLMPSQAQRGLRAEPQMGFVLNRAAQLKFGAYCHVRKPGTISVGDEVFLERRPRHSAMAYVSTPLPADIASGNVAEPPPLPAFYQARVVGKRRETADTVTFGLRMPPGTAFPFLPGQHLILRLAPVGLGRPLMRSYSLSSGSWFSDGADYAITVKRIGIASSYLLDSVEVGDELDVRWPSGRFFVVPEADAPLALISNGIGATPLFAMLQRVAEANPARRIFWLHATRDSRTHVFKDAIRELGQGLADFRAHTIYRNPQAADVRGVDYQSCERIDAQRLAPLAGMAGVEVFICGTESFTACVRDMVAGTGIAPERIHSEKFFSTVRSDAVGERAANADARTWSVRFERSGVEAQWTQGDPTLLEIAEQSGIPADYGCRFGSCLACSTRIIEGEVKYTDAEVVPKPGEALICCAEPVSDLVLDL